MLLKRPRNLYELPTSSWPMYLRNLRSQIDGTRQALEKRGHSPGLTKILAARELVVGQIMVDLDQVARAETLATEALQQTPKDGPLYALRARARFTLHKWPEVEADLKALAELAPQNPTLLHLRAEMDWAQGRADKALAAFTAQAKAAPSLTSVARLGHVFAERVGFDAADKAFARAETLYEEVAPAPLAWLAVQRAVLRLDHGRFEEALIFLEGAYERAPGHPLVLEHLARTCALLGQLDRAIELHKAALEIRDHPEHHDALAGLYERKALLDEARHHRAQANARAKALFTAHPAAMAGHAVGLLSGADREAALATLTAEVKARPVVRALVRLAQALIDDDNLPEAARIIEQALATRARRADVHWIAARVARLQGDQARSQAEADKAKAINPRIQDLMGPR